MTKKEIAESLFKTYRTVHRKVYRFTGVRDFNAESEKFVFRLQNKISKEYEVIEI